MNLQKKLNREEWLTEVARLIEPLFRGFSVGKYVVTCGWPATGGLGRRKITLGQCFGPESSKAGISELFISPLLDKPLEVAGTLAHEMAHVIAGIKAAHGKGFLVVCSHIGLTKGSPTTRMPGARLNDDLAKVIEKVGGYPHIAMAPVARIVTRKRTSIGLCCADCGCKAVMSLKWIGEAGLPVCGCGGAMEIVEPEVKE